MSQTPDEVGQLQSKLDEADRERSELLRRAEVAEAIAEERGKALDDMRVTLRMLETGQSPTVQEVAYGLSGSPSTEAKAEGSPTKGPLEKVKWRHKIFGSST